METPQNVGAINPFALTEAITGKRINWQDPASIKIMENALEKKYNELFDMKFDSPLFAGLKLNTKTNTAELLKASEIQVRPDSGKSSEEEEPDIDTPVLAPGKIRTTSTRIRLEKTLSNRLLTPALVKWTLPLLNVQDWTPSGATWKDQGDFFNDVAEFNDPVQGAVGNCYFIAAIAALAWADPYRIKHQVRAIGTGETQRTNSIQFYSKGGGKNAPSKLVEVTDSTIVRTSNNNPVYCRSQDAGEIWPAVFEKAFAKWITKTNSDKPDITKTAFGDPVKAITQINNKSPHYYYTNNYTATQLYDLVRGNSMSYKTIHPMTAWTYGSGKNYSGTNVVGNHAYTVLGWAYKNGKKYIVLRNPWGVTEPSGLNTHQGLLSFFDKSFWRPVNTIGNDGVFALEASSFKSLFAGMGVAK